MGTGPMTSELQVQVEGTGREPGDAEAAGPHLRLPVHAPRGQPTGKPRAEGSFDLGPASDPEMAASPRASVGPCQCEADLAGPGASVTSDSEARPDPGMIENESRDSERHAAAAAGLGGSACSPGPGANLNSGYAHFA